MVLSVIMAFSCFACADNGGGGYKTSEQRTALEFSSLTFNGLGAGVMPIGGFCGPNDIYAENGYKLPSLITEEIFKKVEDAGVNLIFDKWNDAVSDKEVVENLLTLADSHNMSYLISDSDIMNFLGGVDGATYSSVDKMTMRLLGYEEHKSFGGVYGRDEPSANFFNKIKLANANFDEANKEFDNKYGIYYNLFPPVGGQQLSGTSQGMLYPEYLEKYLETDPKYLMYDTYPFVGLEGQIAGSWFTVMAQIRNAAESKNIPWMGYIQTGGNFMDVLGAHRVATEGEMIWSINTMVAHGAKGFAYFPMFTPPEWTQQENAQDNALINKFGAKNPFYYYAQKANKQIAAIDHVLMNSKNLGVMSHGDSSVLVNKSVLLDSFREVKKISGDSNIIGCFDYNGKTALYVVNNSTQKSRAEVNIEFDDNYGYQVIQRGVSADVRGKRLSLLLAEGEGVLIVLK